MFEFKVIWQNQYYSKVIFEVIFKGYGIIKVLGVTSIKGAKTSRIMRDLLMLIVYILSRYLIDIYIPRVIQVDFLCIYYFFLICLAYV